MHFLSEYEGADIEMDDQPKLRETMRRIANQASSGTLTLEEARKRFNRVLKGRLNYEWIGDFDEMVSGKRRFCQKVRAQLLQAERGVPEPGTERLKDFIVELRLLWSLERHALHRAKAD